MTDRTDIAATRKGTEDGTAAASWFFDGNTTREHYARVLQGIEDGDPEILDLLPACDLSGQWADEPAGPQVFADIIREAHAHAGDDPGDEEINEQYGDLFNEVLDTYQDAFNLAAQHEVERMARARLED